MKTDAKIAIVGGGIAGSSVALYLGELGLDVTLFEKSVSLVNGPPICHLHAGGNLYREISDEQCITLLKESVDLVRFYPKAVDYRPTVIAVPIMDSGKPEELFSRLTLLQNEYKALIESDKNNQVLGKWKDYYKLYYREQIEALREKKAIKRPQHFDEWMIPVSKNIDLGKIQFPIIMVQEYGLNLFRLGSCITLSLEKLTNTKVLTSTKVTNVQQDCMGNCWIVEYKQNGIKKESHFDYLINAAGFKTGSIDDMLGFKRDRLVEFKAAYVAKWEACDVIWPEVVFYGERGTPNGMAQLTPYPNGYFQLHGMTKDITLFKGGLAQSTSQSAQPKLDKKFLNKIDKRWKLSNIMERSESAIQHLSQFIPAFHNGKVASKPLFGAQQIPGLESSLRTADVTFEKERYARCEIVKASSVLSMADAITKQLIELGYIGELAYKSRNLDHTKNLMEHDINKYARLLCQNRDYPLSLASRNISESIQK